eukprot:m.282412 g.282412  ORF g.282412 m.282412 type:complete len:1077 (+) comp22898_c3_seq22:1095-4325(+)
MSTAPTLSMKMLLERKQPQSHELWTGSGTERDCPFRRCQAKNATTTTTNRRSSASNIDGVGSFLLSVCRMAVCMPSWLLLVCWLPLVVYCQPVCHLCACSSNNGLVVDCGSLGLTSLRPLAGRIPVNTTTLMLNNNSLTELEDNALALLPESGSDLPLLTHLEITYNRLTRLGSLAFAHAPNLDTINVHNNYISGYLPRGLLLPTPKLTQFQIYSNRLTGLPSDSFRSLTAIFTVALSYNNITSIEPGTFANFGSLMFVLLSHNRITSLEPYAFANTSMLNWVDLSFNLLRRVDAMFSTNMFILSQVSLNNNLLTYVDPGLLSSTFSMDSLWVGNNHLTVFDLDLSSLGSLTKLYLNNNQITQILVPLNLPGLNELRLQQNQLTSLPSFAQLPQLNKLNLQANLLTALGPNVFAGLENNVQLTILLDDNNIAEVDQHTFYGLLTGAASAQFVLMMTNNPSSCFLMLDNGQKTMACECAAGTVGRSVTGGYATGCVLRSTIMAPPTVAISDIVYSFNSQSLTNDSICNPSFCCVISAFKQVDGQNYTSIAFGGVAGNWDPAFPNSVFQCPVTTNWTAMVLPAEALYDGKPIAQSMSLEALPNTATQHPIKPVLSNTNFPFFLTLVTDTTLWPVGVSFDNSTNMLQVSRRTALAPTTVNIYQLNNVFQYVELLAAVQVSVPECDTVSCNGGVCQYLGSPYDGHFSCDCTEGKLGPRCEFDTLTGSADYWKMLGSLAAEFALLVVFTGWFSNVIQRQGLHERLLSAEEEFLALQKIWEISPGDLEMGNELARGSFGAVYAGRWHDLTVAVKCLHGHLLELDASCAEEFDREVRLMKSIRHPNIVLFFGAGTLNDGTPFLVTELLQGSLREFLDRTDMDFSYSQKVQFALDFALGCNHLHSLGTIHRDLKCANALVSANLHVKVADFGTSRLIETVLKDRSRKNAVDQWSTNSSANSQELYDIFRTMTTQLGSLPWMAPELHQEIQYGPKIDVYSYGVCLFEIFTRVRPWLHIPNKFFGSRLREAVLNGERPIFPDDCPPCPDHYRGLMERCWDQTPQKRPTFPIIVRCLAENAPIESLC